MGGLKRFAGGFCVVTVVLPRPIPDGFNLKIYNEPNIRLLNRREKISINCNRTCMSLMRDYGSKYREGR